MSAKITVSVNRKSKRLHSFILVYPQKNIRLKIAKSVPSVKVGIKRTVTLSSRLIEGVRRDDRMIELSGRQITGAVKMSDRHAAEFNAIVEAVDKCGENPVRLDLTDLNISGLWRRDAFFELAVRPNLTLILDPETASILRSYLTVTKEEAKFEVRELDVAPKEEDPRIQEKGMKYAKCAKLRSGYARFNIADTGIDTISSIGISGQCLRRAIELVAKTAHKKGLKFVIDFTDVSFEGGCDTVLAEALVECKKLYRIPVRVFGDEGIAEYVRVSGNVNLTAEQKVRFFKRLLPGTVLRLNTYRTAFRSDVSGRKGSGALAGASLVLYKGLEGTDVLFDEIPTQKLYTDEDIVALGETAQTGDIRIPRRRSISELGIYGMCSGTHGHFGLIDKNEVYQVSDGQGNLIEMKEPEFVARGLKYLGLPHNEQLLREGRIVPMKKKA